MHTQVKNTLNEYSILIIHNDAECVGQLSYVGDLESSNSILTTTLNDAISTLLHLRPQVIVVHVDDHTNMELLEAISSTRGEMERPVLIVVSDNPSSDLFTLADQVIPKSHLPFIEQIIITHVTRLEFAIGTQAISAKLEAENQHLNQQVEFANQTKAEINILKQAVVHSVSHELRTPMLQVKSAVALLNEDENTNRNIVELAMEATTRLESGIRNVTLLNELMNESSNVESFTAVPIIQIIQAALRNLGRSWEHKKDIERVEIVPNAHTSTVLCDKQRLTIAIQLLLDNALKFSRDKVKVKFVHSGSKVAVSIRDKGIGIPQDQLDRIFEPFYQIDGSSTRRFGGMGIGLAIVQLIMEQHCTAIQIESTHGKGSTFTFDLKAVSD